jgi:rubrerythrin
MIQGEVSGDAGYQFWADNETDEEVAKLLRLNGREESIHAERLNEVIALLS